MCERLVELREAMARYASSFDAALLSAEGAALAVVEAAAIERMAATVKGLAAARSADIGAWRGAGERSAAHHLARTTGTSVAQAGEVIDTARRLATLPAVAAAARAGGLSAPQAAAVADAAAVDAAAEARLVATAGRCSLAELRQECARTKAAALPDAEARRAEIHARRQLRTWTDAGGAWNLHMVDNPEVGAAIMGALGPLRDRLFAAARRAGRREAPEAYAADALAELAGGAGSGGDGASDGGSGGGSTGRRSRSGAKMLVRVDLDALLRGRAVAGEVCEIAGVGPVAVSAVRDLLDTGDPFLGAVVTRGEQVLGVAHLRRRPSASQQSALEWLYPSCAAEGCSASTWLENDHRRDWATSRMTVLDLLDRLCTHHHDLKSVEGWGLVEGRGKRAFVPPHDPRHPRHAHAPPSAA